MSVHVYMATGFEEVELITLVDILRRADIDTRTVALSEQRLVTGAHGIAVEADAAFSDVAQQEAKLIILPGGGPGTQAMLAHAPLHERLQTHFAADRRIAAICAAPMVLARIGLLADRQATCFPGCETVLVEGGAKISGFNVVTDGLITTSRGPATAAMLALALVAQLKTEALATQVGRAMLYC